MTTTAAAMHGGTVPRGPAPDGGRLDGTMVGDLGTAEQFALWALRRRRADGAPGSDRLVAGFRLALGLSLVEPGLAAFERVFAALRDPTARDLSLAPLRCACLTRDETALLGLLGAAQAGGDAVGTLAAGLTGKGGGEAASSLATAAAGLAATLTRADLRLPRRGGEEAGPRRLN